jgi:Tol biopolymer transport system component
MRLNASPVRVLLAGVAGAVLAIGVANVPAAHAASGDTERVSVATDGSQANNISGRRSAPASSADGRAVVFDSLASNLVPGDTNAFDDIFVRDRAAGATQRVSVSSSGAQGNNISSSPAISADGRFVAFVSAATNLVPGDTNAVRDIFVHDRATGTTERVSVSSSGAQSTGASGGSNGATNDVATIAPAISADGRFVAFESVATNLVHGDTNGQPDVFVRDRQTATTERVSLSSKGAQANRFSSRADAISGDGRFVVFSSWASNLVPGDTNDRIDIFVRDRQSGTTQRVSVSSSGQQGDRDSSRADISDDGRFVVFASSATNLVAGDTNATDDVFVRDLQAGTTQRVSVSSGAAQTDGASPNSGIRGGTRFGPAISGDGRFAVFDSSATNLVPGDTNTCGDVFSGAGTCPDVFVHDLVTGATERVSVDSSGAQGNGASTDPDISADGTTVVFFSAAGNLVPGDTNGCSLPAVSFPSCPDIFAHTR